MRYILLFSSIMLFALSLSAQKAIDQKTKILFVPLDDRPTSLQFTDKLVGIGNAQVIYPPKDMLGKFVTPGNCDGIIDWIRKQDLESMDAAIIAVDMISYGGLVASRVFDVSEKTALGRMGVLKEIKKRNPRIKIFAQNVIMRIAPTGDGKNEAYRAKLAEWGEVSVKKDKVSRQRTRLLVKEIPTEALADYKKSRKRNLKINLRSVQLVKDGIIDYLLLSQDDARPQGIHIADREDIIRKIAKEKLAERVTVQPGTDEVSMLLLARLFNKEFDFSPRIKVVYSSEKMSNEVMPYEDKPLHTTVSDQIISTASQEVTDDDLADIFFYVFTSRYEAGNAERMSKEINERIKTGKKVMVVDIDPIGDVQGGDSTFLINLQNLSLLPRIYSYAAWNTAGNAIGTSLSQGLIYLLAEEKLSGNKRVFAQSLSSQHWFTIHRILDDFYYHNLVRGSIKKMIKSGRLDADVTENTDSEKSVIRYSVGKMNDYFEYMKHSYLKSLNSNLSNRYACSGLNKLQFSFPWNRIFEAEIDFDFECVAD